MTSNLGFSLIEHRLITGNPYNYYSNLKYLDESQLMNHFKITMHAKRQARLYEMVLSAAKKQDVSSLLSQKKPEYLTGLEIALRSLNKQAYIHAKYKYKFNSKKQVTEIVIDELSIHEKGKRTLHEIQHFKALDYKATYMAFVRQAKARIEEVDILNVTKDELIGFFESVQSEVTEHAILDFRQKRIRDLVFDLYTGKIVIHNKEAFKKFVDGNSVHQLEARLKDFIRDTVEHMTEAKIIINALLTDTFHTVDYFMSKERIVKHLGYLSDSGLVRLDFSYDMTVEIRDIKIHKFVVTDEGRAYLESPALLKVKHKLMGRHLAMMLKSFVNEKEQKKALEQNEVLNDLIASEHLH